MYVRLYVMNACMRACMYVCIFVGHHLATKVVVCKWEIFIYVKGRDMNL